MVLVRFKLENCRMGRGIDELSGDLAIWEIGDVENWRFGKFGISRIRGVIRNMKPNPI